MVKCCLATGACLDCVATRCCPRCGQKTMGNKAMNCLDCLGSCVMIDIDTDEFERGQIGLQNSYGTGYAYNKYGCYFMPPYSCCSWCCFRYDGLCCYPCRGLDKYGINFTGFKLCLWYLLMCKCCHKKKKSTYEREEEMKRNAANGSARKYQ